MSYHPSEKEISNLVEVYAATCAGVVIEDLKGADKVIQESSDLSASDRNKIVKEIAKQAISKISAFLNNNKTEGKQ